MDRRAVLTRLVALAAIFGLPVGFAHASEAENASTFRRIYDDPVLRDRFFLFLQNIFHLYPEAAFHQAIIDLCAANTEDRAIYEALQVRLAEIAPLGSSLTYAMPALKLQKTEMAQQAAVLLAEVSTFDGYIEIGTTGRYVSGLRKTLPLKGRTVLINDLAPGFGPVDLLERGQVRKIGTFVPLGDYDPVDPAVVPDASVDLVSSFIGFHHCPPARLDGFVASLRRVLRPGGRLIVREHDVATPVMDTFVALAHDVFNAGVEVPWVENAKQIRAFRSVAGWTTLLEGAGFRREQGAVQQSHDPTDNTLLHFVRA